MWKRSIKIWETWWKRTGLPKWEDQNGDGEYSSDEIVYPESAFVAMNYKGEIKAMVGATGEKTQSLCFNYATMEQRQPGSTIKPLTTYGLALGKRSDPLGFYL